MADQKGSLIGITRRLSDLNLECGSLEQLLEACRTDRETLSKDKAELASWLQSKEFDFEALQQENIEIEEENSSKFLQLHRSSARTLRGFVRHINEHNSKVDALAASESELAKRVGEAKNRCVLMRNDLASLDRADADSPGEGEINRLAENAYVIASNIDSLESAMRSMIGTADKADEDRYAHLRIGDEYLEEDSATNLARLYGRMYNLSRKLTEFRIETFENSISSNRNLLVSAVPGYVILLGLLHLYGLFFMSSVDIANYTVLEDFVLIGTNVYILIGTFLGIGVFIAAHRWARQSAFRALDKFSESFLQGNLADENGEQYKPYPIESERAIRRIGWGNRKLLVLALPLVIALLLGFAGSPEAVAWCKKERYCQKVAENSVVSLFLKSEVVNVYMTIGKEHHVIPNQRVFASLTNYVFTDAGRAADVADGDSKASQDPQSSQPPTDETGAVPISTIRILKKSEIDCFYTSDNLPRTPAELLEVRCTEALAGRQPTGQPGDPSQLKEDLLERLEELQADLIAELKHPVTSPLDEETLRKHQNELRADLIDKLQPVTSSAEIKALTEELTATKNSTASFQETLTAFTTANKTISNDHLERVTLLNDNMDKLVGATEAPDLTDIQSLIEKNNDILNNKIVDVLRSLCLKSEGELEELVSKYFGSKSINECMRSLTAVLRGEKVIGPNYHFGQSKE